MDSQPKDKMNETQIESVEGFATPEQNQEPEAQQVPQQESDKEINFRRMREELEKERLEKEQYAIKIQAYENYLKNNASPVQQVQQEQPEVEESYDPQDWVTNEQFDKRVERKAEKLLKELLDKQEKQRYAEQAPQRIKTACPDIDSVLTRENCQKLREINPQMADMLFNIENEELKTISTYNALKAFLPNEDSEAEEAERKLQENQNLPKSPSSVAGMSPLSQATSFEGRLTPQIKQQMYEEALRLSKG